MQNEVWEQKKKLFDSFVNVFSQFWRNCARAQAYNQLLGALDIQIATASANDKKQLEVFRSVIKEEHEKQIAEVFETLIKLSGKGATEYSAPCAEMLINANNAISENLAPIIAQYDDLTCLFLGDADE